MLDKNNKAARKFNALHKSVMDKFLQFETSLKPIHDKWEKGFSKSMPSLQSQIQRR